MRSKSRSLNDVNRLTQEGHYARNEMDTHADTCCAGANWRILELSGQVCEVFPFLELYKPVNEISVARCVTVWTSNVTHRKYLLVGDQMLWFGADLPHLLINRNQIQAYGIDVNDNPFDHTDKHGMDCGDAFVPFKMTGTIVHFDTHVPTDWELRHLPVIILTDQDWNPNDDSIYPLTKSKEYHEM